LFFRMSPAWTRGPESLAVPKLQVARAGAKQWMPRIDPQTFARICRSLKVVGFKDDAAPVKSAAMAGTEAVTRFHRAGAEGRNPTIVLDNMEAAYLPTLRILRWFDAPRVWSRNAPVFMTWSGAGGGVGVHYDDDDNVVVQLQGRQRWRVSRERMLPSYPDCIGGFRLEPDNCDEYVLEAGDVLYAPRGYWHESVSLEESISVTFGWDGVELSSYLAETLCEIFAVRPSRRTSCHRPWFCFDELTSFADSPADGERFLSTLVANSFVFPASELAAQPNFCLEELDPCASPMQQPASLAPRSNEGERESAAWALARAVAGGGP
jgi:hypothetical protein